MKTTNHHLWNYHDVQSIIQKAENFGAESFWRSIYTSLYGQKQWSPVGINASSEVTQAINGRLGIKSSPSSSAMLPWNTLKNYRPRGMTVEESYFFALKGSKVWEGQKLLPTSRALAHNERDCQYLLENTFFFHRPINFLMIYGDSQRKCFSCKRN